MSMPSIRMYGKKLVQILSHKGLCGCAETEIDIYSDAGIVCVGGSDLAITEINDEYISIKGNINSIAYKN